MWSSNVQGDMISQSEDTSSDVNAVKLVIASKKYGLTSPLIQNNMPYPEVWIEDNAQLEIDSEGKDGMCPVEMTAAPNGAVAKTSYSKVSKMPFIALVVIFITSVVMGVTLIVNRKSQN
ncbi:hypothetical protein RyT2_02330 [Pseudolactococcus yaeyamensis]